VRLVLLWVHVVSAVVWVGGLACQSHVLLPFARRGEVATFAEAARRARPVTWTAVGLVVLTGFYNITQLGPMERVMQSGAGQMVVGKFILVIAMAAIMGQRDFAKLALLRGALATGADPRPDLRAITRMDRLVLLLALVVIYLGLAISRAG
jgi:putative copper export protein